MFRPTLVRCFPVPREYQNIGRDLYKFLETARDVADVETTHRSYTMCQGVFQVFRRRLSLEEAIVFSNRLPAGIRSLFVADWDPHGKKIQPFGSRSQMTEEVRALRPTHNFAPDTAIADVAQALRCCLEDESLLESFDNYLEGLGEEAQSFWSVPQESKKA